LLGEFVTGGSVLDGVSKLIYHYLPLVKALIHLLQLTLSLIIYLMNFDQVVILHIISITDLAIVLKLTNTLHLFYFLDRGDAEVIED
jgi:hypothetical protein